MPAQIHSEDLLIGLYRESGGPTAGILADRGRLRARGGRDRRRADPDHQSDDRAAERCLPWNLRPHSRRTPPRHWRGPSPLYAPSARLDQSVRATFSTGWSRWRTARSQSGFATPASRPTSSARGGSRRSPNPVSQGRSPRRSQDSARTATAGQTCSTSDPRSTRSPPSSRPGRSIRRSPSASSGIGAPASRSSWTPRTRIGHCSQPEAAADRHGDDRVYCRHIVQLQLQRVALHRRGPLGEPRQCDLRGPGRRPGEEPPAPKEITGSRQGACAA